MPIRFASSRRPSRSVVARCLAMPVRMRAVNDNGCAIGDNALLRSALIHFAKHGLKAAAEAHSRADEARAAGDGEQYRHWLGVCRTLDRRMADKGVGRIRQP